MTKIEKFADASGAMASLFTTTVKELEEAQQRIKELEVRAKAAEYNFGVQVDYTNSLTVHKADPDDFGHKLLQTNNAMTWAEEFVRIKKEKGWTLEDIEEGLMVAWFANAMAAQEIRG